MSKFDYFTNAETLTAITIAMKHIKNEEDREDCRQDIFAELYDFMPLEFAEVKTIVRRIAMRYNRGIKKLQENEVGYDE